MTTDPIPLAQALIRCRSVTPADDGALDLVQSALEPLGFACTRLVFGPDDYRVDNLFARRGTEGVGIAVEIESYKEEEKLTRIGAVFHCEKKSHKGIIIGKGGLKLKGIGKSARLEIEALLGTKVFLELFVKVSENWRDDKSAINQFGYDKE